MPDEPLEGNLAVGLGSSAAILGSGVANLLALQSSAAALPWKAAAGIAAGVALLAVREALRARRPGWGRFLLGSAVALILYWLAAAVLVHHSLSPSIGLLALGGMVAAAVALSTPRAGGLACLLALVPALGDAFVLLPGVEWQELFSLRFATLLGLALWSRRGWIVAPFAALAGGTLMMVDPPLPWGLACAMIAGLFAIAVLEPLLQALAWASLGLSWRCLTAWRMTPPEARWDILVTLALFLLLASVAWWMHRRSSRPVRWIALSGLALTLPLYRVLPGQDAYASLAGAGLLVALGLLAVRWEARAAGDRTVLYPLAALAILALAVAMALSPDVPIDPPVGLALAVPGLIWLWRRLDRPILGSLACLLGGLVLLDACREAPAREAGRFPTLALVLGILGATWLFDRYLLRRAA